MADRRTDVIIAEVTLCCRAVATRRARLLEKYVYNRVVGGAWCKLRCATRRSVAKNGQERRIPLERWANFSPLTPFFCLDTKSAVCNCEGDAGWASKK